ncbi:hypothetical protein [Clostridium sp. UBA1056]|uniref:hypothetical protein n=1 Tax=unclassified Clostridium TaxID=2614128 RepID=UPI0032171762
MSEGINDNIKITFVKHIKIEDVRTVTFKDMGFKYDAPIYNENDSIKDNMILNKFYDKISGINGINSNSIERRYIDLIHKDFSVDEAIKILRYDFKKYKINKKEIIMFLTRRSLYGINKNLSIQLVNQFEYLINKIIPRSIQDLFYFVGLDTNGAYWLYFDLAVKKMGLERHTNKNANNYNQIKNFVEEKIKKLVLDNIPLQEIYETTCATKSLINSVLKSIKATELPQYRGSKGERLVEFALLDLGLNYRREISFDDFKAVTDADFNGRYDFVIYDKKKIKYIIEFDGQQHYKYIKRFHNNEKGFKEQQFRDLKKNLYCELKNIKLIRISYKEISKVKSIIKQNLIYN